MKLSTEVNGMRVSTVRLPVNHGFDGVPLWYETMIQTERGGMLEYQWRYSTAEAAEAGHWRVCVRLRQRPESLGELELPQV